MKRLAIIFLCVLFGLALTSSTSAQTIDETCEPPLAVAVEYGEWSSDSQWFTYINYANPTITPDEADSVYGAVLTEPLWEAFSPQTNRYISDFVWWLQPKLTPVEQKIFITDDIIRTSPDGELMIFSTRNEKGGYEYSLGNRTTQQVKKTGIEANAVNLNPFYRVLWSDSGNQVAISTVSMGGPPIVSYMNIKDRNDLLNNVEIAGFDLSLGTRSFVTQDVVLDRLFDISSDGEKILLTASEMTNLSLPTLPSNLIIWYPHEPQASVIVEYYDSQNIAAAAFAPHDKTKILVFFKSGELFLYDVASKSEEKLLTLEPAYTSSFSPDGKWLAYSQNDLRFLDVTAILPST